MYDINLKDLRFVNDYFEENHEKSEFDFINSFCPIYLDDYSDSDSSILKLENIIDNRLSIESTKKRPQKKEEQKKISFVNHKIGKILK